MNTAKKAEKKELDFFEISDKSHKIQVRVFLLARFKTENYCEFLIKSEEIISV